MYMQAVAYGEDLLEGKSGGEIAGFARTCVI